MVSDYININRALMKMLNGNGISDIEIYDKLNGELQGKIQSTNHNGETRQIEDLVRGRITINSIMRIEYGECQSITDSDDISGKAFDFSKCTVEKLIIQGYEDTCAKCGFVLGR